MEYGKLGNTDIKVSKLCVGCMSFGKAGTMHDWTLDDAAGAFDVKLTAEDLAYLEEPYVPHKIVGAIDKNPEQDVILLDEKK